MTEDKPSASQTKPNQRRRFTPLFVGIGLCAVVGAGFAIRPATSPAIHYPSSIAEGQFLDLVADKDGVVQGIAVTVGDELFERDELIFLDDKKEQELLTVAQAELQAVSQQMKGMDVAVALPSQTMISGTFVSSGEPIFDRVSYPPKARGPITSLPPVEGTGKIEVRSGEPGSQTAPTSTTVESEAGPDPKAVSKANEKIIAIQTEISDLERSLEDARMSLDEANRAVATSEGIAMQAKQEAERLRILLQQGVVPANKVSQAEANAMMATGNIDLAKEKSSQASQRISQTEAEIEKAKGRLVVAKNDLKESEVVQRTKKVVALTSPFSSSESPANLTQQRPGRVVLKSSAPQPIPTKVNLDLSAMSAADTQLDAVQEKVDKAEQELLSRRILAPQGMRVVEILVKPGQAVKKGQVVARFEKVPTLDWPDSFKGLWWNFEAVEDYTLDTKVQQPELLPFQGEQFLLSPQTTAIPTKGAISGNDSVTRNKNGNGVGTIGSTNRPNTAAVPKTRS